MNDDFLEFGLHYGDTIRCPVCGNEFVLTPDASAIVGKSYACSWKCFLDNLGTGKGRGTVAEIVKRDSDVPAQAAPKKRGRPKKT